MKEVIQYLNNLLNNKDVTVVGCSGGPDSMALLDIIYQIGKVKNIKIICAHINHNVREESPDEENLVFEYCKKHNIIFESMKIEEKILSNFEMEARKIRYNYFENIVKKYKAKYLFTAHHGDDLIETVLMRLNRGSTLKGYKGIDIISDKQYYKIVRPLLLVTKKDLIDYVTTNHIEFAIDKSNEENNHTRNRYRHFILPFLKQENKNVHLKYKRFSEELKLYDDFVESYIKNNCKSILKDNQINIELLNEKDKLIKIKLIEKLLNNIYDGNLEIITQKHVEQIFKLISNNKNNTRINLPQNFIGIIEYNYFKIIKENKTNSYNYILDNNLTIENGKFEFLNYCEDKSNYIIRLDSKEIKLPLHIRSRENGDKIEIKNLNGSKKVSDILTNEKIKYTLRKTIPIVTDDENQIIWIPGVKKSKFDKEKNEKYDIIIKYILFKEENNE